MGAFADQVRKACETFLARAEAMPALVVEEAGRRAIERSPVGKPALWKRGKAPKGYVPGNFKSNWRVGVDRIDRTTTDEKNSFFLHGTDRIPAKGMGHRYYISNALPYAWPLETGHSTQSRGMVGLTALEFDTIVKLAAERALSIKSRVPA